MLLFVEIMRYLQFWILYNTPSESDNARQLVRRR